MRDATFRGGAVRAAAGGAKRFGPATTVIGGKDCAMEALEGRTMMSATVAAAHAHAHAHSHAHAARPHHTHAHASAVHAPVTDAAAVGALSWAGQYAQIAGNASAFASVIAAEAAARHARPAFRPAGTTTGALATPTATLAAQSEPAVTVQSVTVQSVTAQAVPAPVLPVMANSDNWYSAIVNANQYITSQYYMPNLSPDLTLITDLSASTMPEWTSTVATVQAAHPNTLIGTYHSMRDAQLAGTFTTQPPRAVPREGLTASQILMTEPFDSNAQVVNYSQTAARKYLVNNVVQDVVKTGSKLAYIDNVSHNETGFPISWATTTSVLKDMTSSLHAQGKRVIANAAWSPGVTSNTSVDQFIATGVDGVSLEMAFPVAVRTDITKINTAMAQYRKMLDAGLTIVFIPLATATGGDNTTDNMNIEQRLQAAFGMMFRKPGDRLFTNQVFWESIPEWADWTKRFGPALGAATVTTNAAGEIVMTREFTNYTLTANVTTKEVITTAK